ncbi:BTB/POZ and MATH domain-containing protein 5-like isoform X1 [Alnus glutinosa]|uniref:BTB/POZ and MATH domain-containing protein 5-like isoform X1 n=2 Tax=Alnus glutinosa TaxID=3517 RepID=UPI002D781B4B|nr:BTB/POZ and MATH domain-containing protein 5-like isoform X1 [Alnus glutinosa]
MEEKTCHPLPAVDNDASGIVQSIRDHPPTHYTFQIKNFSLLFGMEEEKCHSGEFEVGGYQWRLVLYPNGKKNSDGNGHISLYLAIAHTNDLPLGWEVNVNIRFFVFDQIRDKYLTIQDANGRVRRFHNLKTEWGFAQLLSHDTLNDPSNGYLLDDTCVFGVEVFVIKATGKGETLSMINQPQHNYFTWRIDNYSNLKGEAYFSEHFTVEGRRWELKLKPGGSETGADTCLSLYLCLGDSEILPPNRKLYAKYKLRIRDQVHGNHLEKTVENWFSDPNEGYGFHNFLSKRDLQDTSKGYLVGEGVLIECKIDVISVVNDFSSN